MMMMSCLDAITLQAPKFETVIHTVIIYARSPWPRFCNFGSEGCIIKPLESSRLGREMK